jgi:hypothetical protein
MKNFDLAAAKAGAPVCTTFGRKVRILCFDKKGETPVVAAVDFEDHENEYAFDEDGTSPYMPRLALMMRDDNYAEKLARGEYGNHIEDKFEKVDPTIKENLTVDREYWRRVYAGMAMQGIFAGRNWCKGAAVPDCIDYAQDAVKLADALLEELEKTEKKL